MDKGNENFYRNSANQLIHTLLYMDAIPKVIRGIIPISYERVPDYCQSFTEEELEQQVTERDRELVMKCISQVILKDPNGSIDVVVVQMYEDGSITQQTQGSWSTYDHQALTKDELSPQLRTWLLENTVEEFKYLANKYLED